MTKSGSLKKLYIDLLVAVTVLGILIANGVARFSANEYAGMRTDSAGRVIVVCTPESGDLQVDDHILAVNGVTWNELLSTPTLRLFQGFAVGDLIPVERQRGETVEIIKWRFPGFTNCELFHRARSELWLGLVFWLAGVLAILHVRPRSERRRLLIAFFFITAIWVSWGGGAWRHILGSHYVFRFAIWLAVPIYLHLHWIFPTPLSRLPRWLLLLGYCAVAPPWLLEGLNWLPRGSYNVATLAASVGVLLIIFLRLAKRPDERSLTLILATGYLLTFGLTLIAALLAIFGIDVTFELSSVPLLTAIPGFYFYVVVYQQFPSQRPRLRRILVFSLTILILVVSIILFIPPISYSAIDLREPPTLINSLQTLMLGLIFMVGLTPLLAVSSLAQTHEQELGGPITIRANPLLSPFLFLVLLISLNSAFAIFLINRLDFGGSTTLVAFGVSIIATLATWLIYPPFRQLVNRQILGIKLAKGDLLSTFAAQISTSPDRQTLARLLSERILPSLLLRQSQLLVLQKKGSDNRLYGSEVLLNYNTPPMPTNSDELLGRFLKKYEDQTMIEPIEEDVPAWIRLILPLQVGDQLVGVWLLGQQDPGEQYEVSTTRLLRALADQMAIALANILQTENLQRLYRANIDRHEAERGRLARELHDEVLNQLASVTMFLNDDDTNEQFDRAYAELTRNLRRTISGLRPAMLAYGLPSALEELRDDVEARGPDQNIAIDFSSEDDFVRYPPRVEEYLFRIAQQAIENALMHARASRIEIEGEFTPGTITLRIRDDGRGFPAGSHPDLSSLLAQRHFGLAGMYERAELINAALELDSAPGAGTLVSVTWDAGRYQEEAL